MSHGHTHGASGGSEPAGVVADSPAVVELSEAEAAAVAEVATAYAAAVPESRSAPYTALVRSVLAGRVAGDEVTTLEQVLTLALETGKAFQVGLAEGEQLLSRVLARTPSGKARAEEVRAVNDVLAQLAGRELGSVRVRSQKPGRWTIDVGVTGFRMSLVLDQSGAEIRQVTTG